jgi:hypothetical protein
VWNEPNAYTSSGPGPGEFSGSSFIYPSNFAWLQKRSYVAIKAAQPGAASTVISGGLLGHDIGGATVTLVKRGDARQTVTKHSGSGAPRAGAGTTCTSNVPSGADYLCNTYRMGQQKAAWTEGAYPLDGIGQHPANQAKNVQTAYSMFRGICYLLRADYFVAQDVPEGNVFYGLVQGDGTTYKAAFSAYQKNATY